MTDQPTSSSPSADKVERYEIDVDGDGVPDGTEVIETRYMDVDEDGTADMVVVTDTVTVDVDHDGRPDAMVVTETVGMDVTGDGRVDAIEVTRTTLRADPEDGNLEVVEVEELDVTEVPQSARPDGSAGHRSARPSLALAHWSWRFPRAVPCRPAAIKRIRPGPGRACATGCRPASRGPRTTVSSLGATPVASRPPPSICLGEAEAVGQAMWPGCSVVHLDDGLDRRPLAS